MKLVTLAIAAAACTLGAGCAKTSATTQTNRALEATTPSPNTCSQEQLAFRNNVGQAFQDLYSTPSRKTAAYEIEKCKTLKTEMSDVSCAHIRGDGSLAEVGYTGRVKELCEEFIADGAQKTARRFLDEQKNSARN